MLDQMPSELSAAGAKCGVRSLPGGPPGPSSFQYSQKKPKAEKPKCLRLCIKRTSLHSFSLFGGRVLPVWKGVGCRWWKITLISGKNWPAAAADCTRADGWKIKTLVSRSTTLQPSPRPYFLEKVMEQGCINSAQKWKHGNRPWDAHHRIVMWWKSWINMQHFGNLGITFLLKHYSKAHICSDTEIQMTKSWNKSWSSLRCEELVCLYISLFMTWSIFRGRSYFT